MALYDLHTHTTFSDGRLSPPGLVEKAALRGLTGIAVTDHDSVAAIPLAKAAAERLGLRIISGVELSADVDGLDVHILAYGFDEEHRGLKKHLEGYRESRIDRARQILERLERVGAPVEMDRVLQHAAGGSLGRPHIAQALVDARHVSTIGEAFNRYLADGAAAHVPKTPISPADLIEVVTDAGGVTVLAHPGEYVSEGVAKRLMGDGLRGIEVQHPSHDEVVEMRWTMFAERMDLLMTGGSDYHGYRPGEEENFGRMGVPTERVEALLAAGSLL